MVPSSRDGLRTRRAWGAARGATLVAYHVADCGGDDQACAFQAHDQRRVIPTPLGPSRAWTFLGSGAKRIQLQTRSQQWSPLLLRKKGRAPGDSSRPDSQEAQCFTRSDPAAHPTRASDGGSEGSTSIEYIITP